MYKRRAEEEIKKKNNNFFQKKTIYNIPHNMLTLIFIFNIGGIVLLYPHHQLIIIFRLSVFSYTTIYNINTITSFTPHFIYIY